MALLQVCSSCHDRVKLWHGETATNSAGTAGQCFKGRQFTAEVILWAMRWYLMFPISYRDLELMLLATRGCSTCRTACGCTTSGRNSRHQVVCIRYTALSSNEGERALVRLLLGTPEPPQSLLTAMD
jgi:hypothetical protein